ncbi:hypothetical protein AURDEDRAFT_130852 [Auricularia subglabra TFB-10046 SS5]|uniref:Uncharacterized protein n=1 Tax=Auricularia subglabra (strain TFB-10046 / SS5) TaxID=717982 RepID=J0WQV7_AURST|nr:hypothetical protein AURDEDRAFT_130852 [Auricularia subglabra TFB-10046 SS5]
MPQSGPLHVQRRGSALSRPMSIPLGAQRSAAQIVHCNSVLLWEPMPVGSAIPGDRTGSVRDESELRRVARSAWATGISPGIRTVAASRTEVLCTRRLDLHPARASVHAKDALPEQASTTSAAVNPTDQALVASSTKPDPPPTPPFSLPPPPVIKMVAIGGDVRRSPRFMSPPLNIDTNGVPRRGSEAEGEQAKPKDDEIFVHLGESENAPTSSTTESGEAPLLLQRPEPQTHAQEPAGNTSLTKSPMQSVPGTPRYAPPGTAQVPELLQLMKGTLARLGWAFDTLHTQSSRAASLVARRQTQIQSLRRRMRAQDKRQESRIGEVKHLVQDVLKDQARPDVDIDAAQLRSERDRFAAEKRVVAEHRLVALQDGLAQAETLRIRTAGARSSARLRRSATRTRRFSAASTSTTIAEKDVAPLREDASARREGLRAHAAVLMSSGTLDAKPTSRTRDTGSRTRHVLPAEPEDLAHGLDLTSRLSASTCECPDALTLPLLHAMHSGECR